MKKAMPQDPFEHGGNLYKIRRSANTKELLDFSANINPLGLPRSVRQVIEENIDEIIHYPDAEAYALKQSLAKSYALPFEKLILGNGAVELLYVLCHHLRPRKVLIPAPSFSEYERASRAAGAQVSYYGLPPENGFFPDIKELGAKAAAYDMLFIGNPNNPTGTMLTQKEIAAVLDEAKRGNTMVVVDESFIDFALGNEAYTAKPLLERFDNLVVLHSLTKFYAIPGLRLGFAAANESLAAALHLCKDPWNVNSLAQAAGVAALGDKAYAAASREFIVAEKESFYQQISMFSKLKAYRPSVNFMLADIKKTGLTSAAFQALCLKEKILVRDCSNYPGLSGKYVRFAIKAAAENKVLMKALTKILGGEQE